MKLLPAFPALLIVTACVPSRSLVELSSSALVTSETSLVDFGARDSRSYLVSGWSAEETSIDGTSFVWATGESSRIRFFVAEPRPLEVSFRAWPFRFPGAPVQRLALELNGGPLADVTLLDSPSEYRVKLPPQLQVEGDNLLDIGYAYHRSPREALPGASDPRPLSVGWDWLRLEGAMAPPKSIAREDALVIPYGSRVDFVLDVPPESRLEVGAVRPFGKEGPSPHLAISMRTISATDSRTVPPSPGFALPLGSESGLVTLSFQARTGGGGIEDEGGLMLRRPVVIPGATESSRSSSGTRRPNVIVILIDTLRADHLGAYGDAKGTSPNIDAFAEDGSLFERAYAQSSWTKPSVASLLTGLLPRAHGANRREDALPEEAETLPERLRMLGYRTAGFVTNTNVASEFGFAQGFETYELLLDDDERLGYARAEVLVARALGFLSENRTEPFFLYLHATDPHDPYTFTSGGRETVGSVDFMEALEAGEIPANEALRESLIDLYDEKIRYADRELGKLFDELKRKGLYRDSLIVLASDHGEEFFEHGWWRHGKTLYQEQLHVPLVVKWPGGVDFERRRKDVVQQIDLVPTVLDLLGGSPPDGLPGRTFLRASASDRPVSSYLRSDGREVESVVYRSQKLVRTFVYDREVPPFALFDLAKDPGETKNVLDSRPPAFDFLDALLRRPIDGPVLGPVPAVIDDLTRRRLEALGYVR